MREDGWYANTRVWWCVCIVDVIGIDSWVDGFSRGVSEV